MALVALRDGVQNVGGVAGSPLVLDRPFADLDQQPIVDALMLGTAAISPEWIGIGVAGAATPRVIGDGGTGAKLERQDGASLLTLEVGAPTANDHAATKLYSDTVAGAVTLGSITGTLAAAKGGTGQSAFAVGDLLFADTIATLATLPVGTNGHVLTLSAGLPVWAAPAAGGPFIDLQAFFGSFQTGTGGADYFRALAGMSVGDTLAAPGTVPILSIASTTWNFSNATAGKIAEADINKFRIGAIDFGTTYDARMTLDGFRVTTSPDLGSLDAAINMVRVRTPSYSTTMSESSLVFGQADGLKQGVFARDNFSVLRIDGINLRAGSVATGASDVALNLTSDHAGEKNVSVKTGTSATCGLFVSANRIVGERGAAVADATGGAVVDVEARAAINDLLARLRSTTGHGLIT